MPEISNDYDKRKYDDYDRRRMRKYDTDYDDVDKYERRSRYDDKYDKRRYDDRRSRRYDDRRNRPKYRRDDDVYDRKSRSRSPQAKKDDNDVKEFEPNFSNSGLLAAETKTVNGVVLKYHEPLESHKPSKSDDWRLFVFDNETQVDMINLDNKSSYLFGRDTNVTDYPILHPSLSKQHAVLQFRMIRSKNEFGDVSESVKPFMIDLESTNGTHVNKTEIPTSRFYEIFNGDVIKFAFDNRDFVLIKSNN